MTLLEKLLPAVRIVALDIGARGGFTTDLTPIAAAVEGFGFEPDQEECDRLNASMNTGGLRALRYIPTAVGRAAEQRMLNLYRKRGCSSLLEADTAFATLFAREEYFILDGQAPLQVERLDDAAAGFGFADAHYMKIDIQGAELEAMQSAPVLLDRLLTIRTEVEFAPLYKDQPVFADIDAVLRGKGFMLARFPQLHAWRRGTRVRGERRAPGPAPVSRGQLIHGDALYIRRPETLSAESGAGSDQLIRLALLCYAYGHLDLTAAILLEAPVVERLQTTAAISASALMAELGAAYASGRWHRNLGAALRRLRGAI